MKNNEGRGFTVRLKKHAPVMQYSDAIREVQQWLKR